MTAKRDGRTVYCVITDQYGQTVKTKEVTINMAAAPKITKQPVSVTVKNGATASVSVTATGKGLTYTWYYKDKGAKEFKISSVTTNTYSQEMTAKRNGRTVYCVITDKYGQTVTTKEVTINMAAAPKITKQPVSATVKNGATASVSVTATGDGLTYTWYYKDKGTTVYKVSSVTTSTYSQEMTAKRDGRTVYCVITDQYGDRKSVV